MLEKRTVVIVCPQFKEKKLFGICCENLGWEYRIYETVSDALPYLSDLSIERVFLDFKALTNYQYDIPRLENTINPQTKIVLCIRNIQEDLTSEHSKIKVVSEPFAVGLFLKEMFGDKQISMRRENNAPELLNLIIGDSPAIKETRRFCFKFKNNSMPLLICGSLGTGKRFIAKTISQLSENSTSFLEINLLELSETDKANYIRILNLIKEKSEAQKNTTIYLKNFQAINIEVQLKILIGLDKPVLNAFQQRGIKIIFSITNIKPAEKVHDYFYKNWNGAVLLIPDLNARKADITLLFEHFLNQYNEGFTIPQISHDVYVILGNNRWLGNVRALRLTAAHLSINNSDGIIKEKDLSDYLEEKVASIITPTPADEKPRLLGAFEADYIFEILKSVNGNISKAARQLGITRNTIKSKLKKSDCNLSEELVQLKMSVLS